ncbi:family 10 glycosylhydrolase [Aminipila terrae]|uniref:Family 10 glycosylhydrolase n=1 Tax=Aminipila terrae TaxID=2697030 RepID=A0A6P1MLL1_9FIRM|nr:family 10 glycosylhydrolase [Aminipila terrae]QHI73564.1 family 10 glycosylhydrolase [Aminipila terrae]
MMNEKGIYFSRLAGEKLTIAAFLLLIVLSVLIWGMSAKAVYADSNTNIGVSIDGTAVVLDQNLGTPFIDANSRTLVPFRGVMEKFGGTVDWDNDNRIASVIKNGTTVKVPIDQKYILVNGQKKDNDTAAVIKDGRTYLPIRAVLEAFGAGVAWDNTNRIVVINTDGTVAQFNDSGNQKNQDTKHDGELNAMWISYLEYMSMPKDEAGFKAAVDKMFDRCKNLGMNAVIVHVRSHCDAMYPSKYYPWALFASGKQGVDPGYDPLKYMIDAAHSRGLEFHAWVNPYRVTGYGTYWNQVAANNPVKVWQSDSDTTNDRWALLQKGEYYLNPAIPEVRDMVINGVKEIVENYDVDGIHFDDYFYPSVNDSDPSLCFDKPEYDKSGSSLSIADWRRNNVNMLVKGVYSAIKSAKPNVEFGISPAGNLSNLRKNNAYFVDIDRWLSEDGYVDYIMPQLYWGFETKDSSGNIAPYAYVNNLNSWISLASKGNVKLYVGLDMANAGTNVPDKNATSEWLRYNDIIARQVTTGRATGKVKGYAYFRYEFFNKDVTQNEVNNLVKVIK